MDLVEDTDDNYYIKEIEDEEHIKYKYFYLNKNIPLNEKIIKEMEKYNIVEFGDNFNQRVDNLPYNIQYLTFGESFNQLVNNLPHNIQYLAFGLKFNQPVDNLPSGLQELTLEEEFNQPLGSFLPKGLQRLTISKNYNKTINYIPVSVKIIRSFYM